MGIVIKNGKDSAWKRIPSASKQENGYMRELIYQVPELISLGGTEPGKSSSNVCIRNNLESDGGLIGIDSSGKITIVECRSPDGSSVRREVMGQALDYAASLWEMSYEEFDSMVLDSEGKSLVELMKEKVPAQGWSEQEFKSAVAAALRNGKFRLVMTVHGLTDALKRAIKFLNARGPFSLQTYAVEMQYFSDGEVEVVVPKTITSGQIEQEDSTPRRTSSQASSLAKSHTVKRPAEATSSVEPTVAEQPTESPSLSEPVIAQPERQVGSNNHQKEALFFRKCSETVSESAVQLIRKLYNFSREVADDIIWWGSSGAGAFNFVLTQDGLTVFIVDANGKIMFNFSEWQREPSYKNLLPQFLVKLKEITILRNQREDHTKWPDFGVEEFFANANDFTAFQDSIKFLKEELSKLAFA